MKQFVDENNYPLFDGLVGLKQKPMKTAMQELIKTFHLYQNSACTNEELEILSFYIKCAEDLLEKEKEQIIDAFVECWKANMPDGFECKLNAKEYYNQTYNQNK